MRLYVILTLFLPWYCYAMAPVNISCSLKKILDIKKIKTINNIKIPGYMYSLYQDTENQQYDVIRDIPPETEFFGTHSQLIYNLDDLEPTEIVQKAVLHMEPSSKNQYEKAINASFFLVMKQSASKIYIGSANIHGTIDLAKMLGSRSLTGLDQLIVQVEGPVTPFMGLVLYSITKTGGYTKAHELAKLLFETKMYPTKKNKRSLEDNEINTKRHNFMDESKGKKKKKKGSRINKLQAVETDDSIVFIHKNKCRMEKLVLNFADIGWEDWVIYPKGFETNFCTGKCLFPLDNGSRPTNHATVQSLARSFGRLWDLPEPSCVPETLAPLTLLYMDRSNHVLLKSYPDMRVLTCSCK